MSGVGLLNRFMRFLFGAFLPTALSFLLIQPVQAKADSLISTVSNAYRGDYKVKVCGCGFASYFSGHDSGFSDPDKLEAMVRNVIDVWNDHLEVSVKLVWAGYYDDFAAPGPDGVYCNDTAALQYCTSSPTQPPEVGTIFIRGFNNIPAGGAPANTTCWTTNGSSAWKNGQCPTGSTCGITKCHIGFAANINNIDQYWSFTHTDPTLGNRSFPQVLLHELSHDLGWAVNAVDNEPFSVPNCAISRFPWHEDFKTAREDAFTGGFRIPQNPVRLVMFIHLIAGFPGTGGTT